MANARLIVVEDDAVVAEDLGRQLRSFGYEILEIVPESSLAEARARELRPDLVVMDIFFDGAPTGLEAARELNDRLGIPVVLLSGVSDPNLQLRLLSAHPAGCVHKPIEPTYLRAVVDRALRGSNTVAVGFD